MMFVHRWGSAHPIIMKTPQPRLNEKPSLVSDDGVQRLHALAMTSQSASIHSCNGSHAIPLAACYRHFSLRGRGEKEGERFGG